MNVTIVFAVHCKKLKVLSSVRPAVRHPAANHRSINQSIIDVIRRSAFPWLDLLSVSVSFRRSLALICWKPRIVEPFDQNVSC